LVFFSLDLSLLAFLTSFSFGRQPFGHLKHFFLVYVFIFNISVSIAKVHARIYAIGDIVEGGFELTPVAIRAGQLVAQRTTTCHE
jgi:hypothetical protein